MSIQRTTYWRLTVHHFQRAVDAGVRPEPVTGFSLNESASLYRPTHIDFDNPPRLAEYLQVWAAVFMLS
jgi:hypothetical protein